MGYDVFEETGMSAKILDGKVLSAEIYEDVKRRVTAMKRQGEIGRAHV